VLPLPPLDLHTPASIDEALTLLARLGPDAVIVAGGTDLLPNMKLGLVDARQLVSLSRIRALAFVSEEHDAIRIGATTSLATVASHPAVRRHAAALAEAAQSVGGPHHRRMGTLGGNLCLDTRCRFYNQSHFWRSALGYCLKKDGSVCHVVEGGRKCVAAASNDTAAAFLALGGSVVVASREGSRTIAASDLYTADGVRNTTLAPGELVTEIVIPRRSGRSSAYEKLRRRGAIDFPLLSLAARLDLEDGRIVALEVVVSALAARPRRVAAAHGLAADCAPTELPVGAIGSAARKECNPLPNVDTDTEWRRDMVPVLVKRALGRLTSGPSA
jgi:4-hydroxybenzoyl-CoA reductase subunit beta